MKEIYKPVKGYEKDYYVSNIGNIKAINFSGSPNNIKIISKFIGSHGYYTVSLNKRKYLIHRIVAEAFVCNVDNKKTVNHKNGIKTDNRAENLEWLSQRDNLQHAWNNGIGHKKGVVLHEQNMKIRQIMASKDISKADMARYFGITKNAIYSMLKTDIFARQKRIAEFLGVDVKDIID